MTNTTTNYLGLAGIVSLPSEQTQKYNTLLKYLGTEGMLIQFERLIDSGNLEDLIRQIEDNLHENGIELPYQ